VTQRPIFATINRVRILSFSHGWTSARHQFRSLGGAGPAVLLQGQQQAQAPLAAIQGGLAGQVTILPPAGGAAQGLAGQAAVPPQVGGNIPQAGGAVFQAPVRHRTFASLFADPASDPNYNHALEIVNRFDPSNAAPLTEAALKQALLGQSTPYTYLCCASLHGNVPKLYVVHSLSRYPMSLAGQPTLWDDRIIGFLGEIVGDTAMNVLLPEEIFDELPETLVYTADTLVQELPNLDVAALFPRIRQNAANEAALRRSRFLTYLPTRFANLILDNKGYTPKQVLYIHIQQFQAEGCMEAMTPLLIWLHITLHATGQNDTGPPASHLTLTSPFIDQDLINHRNPF
jgi:hypothetical protein